ncbi:unnamed protein product [Owenia fusiformis]|uniref:Uncharacterized protein n=1 Tax=Owenia fusiformis TaxID=6347 RepID=A0A8J1TMZ6_OWEFU|nr:unnamed protein product [Owenia fusiformis]
MDLANATNISIVGFDLDFVAKRNDLFVKENILVVIFMFFVMIIGSFGNLLVLIVHRTKFMKRTGTYYMYILAGIDFVSCIVIHPYVIHKLFYFYGQSVKRCKISYFFTHISVVVQVFLLTAIAIDRFYTMNKPLDFKKAYKRMRAFVGTSFVGGIILSTPIIELYGIKTVELMEENKRYDGHTCYYSDFYEGTKTKKVFQYFRMMVFIVCAVVIVIMYVKIARTLRRIRPIGMDIISNHKRDNAKPSKPHVLKQIGIFGQNGEMHSQSESSRQSSSASKYKYQAQTIGDHLRPPGPNEKQFGDKLKVPVDKPQNVVAKDAVVVATTSTARTEPNYRGKRSRTVVKILFLVTTMFLVTWLPFWVIRFTLHGAKGLELKKLEIFFNRFVYLNNAINPILYCLVHKVFIKDCKNWFRRMRNRVFCTFPTHCCIVERA